MSPLGPSMGLGAAKEAPPPQGKDALGWRRLGRGSGKHKIEGKTFPYPLPPLNPDM
jgi:hypothetical protein